MNIVRFLSVSAADDKRKKERNETEERGRESNSDDGKRKNATETM